MSYTLSQEQYDKLLALSPAVRDELLTSQELDPNFTGVTEAYNAMTKKVKIDTALDAFKTGNVSGYLTELGDTGLKFSKREVVTATIDAQKSQAALDKLGDTNLNVSEGFFDLKYNNEEATFDELIKQIEVNTGIDINDEAIKSKKQYKAAITKSLNILKKNAPPSVYKERKDIVWNAYRSTNFAKPGFSGSGLAITSKSQGVAPLTEYFSLKQDDTTADSILEGMFQDPEIYQLWLEESK